MKMSKDESEEDEQSIDESEDEQKKEEVKKWSSKYCALSLNYFDFESPVRIFVLRVVDNKWFDRFIIFLIGLNSILLGGMDYTWKLHSSHIEKPIFNKLVDNSELFFTICFTVECVFKIIAYGIWFGNHYCYL